jgi:hypothetical protein
MSPTPPFNFDLTPKVGWEAATGFDYRFPGSSWRISGQFRYGASGTASHSAAASFTASPAVIAALGGNPATNSISGSDSVSSSHRETHWLADLAVGHDIAGTGRNAMQFKGGLRMAEFVANTDDSRAGSLNIVAANPNAALTATGTTQTSTSDRFLGAGPLIGLQGSVPFAGNWSLDYLGDAAILFGNQTNNVVTTSNGVATGAGVPVGVTAFASSITSTTAERFATVFSGDIQAGISYWFTPNLKLGASYRLDALINFNSDPAIANLTRDRYTHGPRLTVTGQF